MERKKLLLNWCSNRMALQLLFSRKSLILLLFIFYGTATLLAQQSKVWNYPIRYGTPEWEKFKTFGERINAYNIPDSLLKAMDTKDLVQTCIHYPNIIIIITRDNVQLGYNDLKSMFNGFRELENRKDAGRELIKLYQKIKPEDIIKLNSPDDRGDFSLTITFLETLLAQKPILQNLDMDETIHLFSISNQVYDKKLSVVKYYEQYGLTTPCLISGRLLDIQDPKSYRQLTSNNPHIHLFLNETFIAEKNDFAQIINASKNYLKAKGF